MFSLQFKNLSIVAMMLEFFFPIIDVNFSTSHHLAAWSTLILLKSLVTIEFGQITYRAFFLKKKSGPQSLLTGPQTVNA